MKKTIIISTLIVLTLTFILRPFITGATINSTNIINYIALYIVLTLLCFALLLNFKYHGKNEKISMKPLEKILDEEGTDLDTIYVLDTSGAIDYRPKMEYMAKRLSNHLFIPDRIKKEMRKTNSTKKILEKYLLPNNTSGLNIQSLKSKGAYKDVIRKYRNIARDALEKTPKHKTYEHLRNITLNNMKKPDYMHEDDFEDYKKQIDEDITKELREKYNKSPTKENTMWLLKKNERASAGDVDVLATALTIASTNKKAKIFGRDEHLRQAVDYLTSKDMTLRSRLKYISYNERPN